MPKTGFKKNGKFLMKKKVKALLMLLAIVSFSVLIACSSDSSDSSDSSTQDYADAASDAGYTVPDVDVRGVSNFNIGSITESKSKTSGSTENGVVNATVELDSDISGTISVFIWINGNLNMISGYANAGENFDGDIVLSPGYNFICIVVYVDGTAWGRSEVVRIDSSTRDSLMRFELIWDGEGDVDLHIDNTAAGTHVYWNGDNYYSSDYDINLDVDNMDAYGPENIRVYSVPSSTEFRCYVNYYSGYSNLTATVKVFDKDNTLIDTNNITLTSSDSGAGSDYNEKSKLVGTYTVNP